jgi:RNA polymerase sigma factor (sigma-70 family)
VRTEDGYIIHRCLNGDSNAFGFLVDKYKAGVYAFAYERLHNFHDAEDISQEVFVKAYKSLRTLKRWDSFASWLYRITLNLCRNWIRAQSSRPDREFTEDQDPEVLEAHSRNTYRQELAYQSVGEALDSLPEMYSQALTLHYFGGMTSMEIAKFTGVSPSAIRMRLRRARSLLKEEILTMMNTEYEQQRLQASFTFRILEAVKRVRIHPAPRTAGLPWGLSLATGIIVTFLTLTPQPSIISRVATATGSPLPVETKVLKTGEIPVDVLEASEIPILASKRGDGDSAGSELPDPQASMLAAANSEDDISTNESASEKQVITDPETVVEYTKIRELTGKKDVIVYNTELGLSPNGKFLLCDKVVIPLDGGEPFDLVDMPAWRGSWSPDGKKVAFYSGAIWVIPVSPDTGRPMGPAKKLLDGDYWTMPRARWSPDSEKLAFERRAGDTRGDIWTISVTDGALTQITGDAVWEGQPIWSPDGKMIAYNRTYELWVILAESGTSRKISDKVYPVSWSLDSKWLICGMDGKLRFFRLANGHEFDITPPKEVGRFLSWSPDGKKMLFYKPSYDWVSSLKVVSASGGPSFELGRGLELWAYELFWSPDSSMVIRRGWDHDRDRAFWIMPLAGGDAFLLNLDVSVPGKLSPHSLSPDGKKILFRQQQDLWVAPVSLKDGRTTGPAVMVFREEDRSPERGPSSASCSWSLDGTKLAIIHRGDIWIASAEGGKPVQITDTPEHEYWPVWSPDGEMIAYEAYHSEKEKPLKVISVSSGEMTKILDISGGYATYAWSPSGKELAVVSEGLISAIPIAGGRIRQVVDLKNLAVDGAFGLCWSPDGQHLAFIGYRTAKESHHIFMVSAEGGEATKLATDDNGEKYCLYWSPDGKWLSYTSDGFIKTRPGGIIWEADVSDLLSNQEREQ